MCAITGESDYIPDAYPGNIRFPSDMAKLFMTKPDKLDGMPQLRAGYVASQKIIHTLQSFFMGWEEQKKNSAKRYRFKEKNCESRQKWRLFFWGNNRIKKEKMQFLFRIRLAIIQYFYRCF